MITKQVVHPTTGVILAVHSFNEEPSVDSWNRIVASYFPPAVPMVKLVQSKILLYRTTASQLLTEMYAENTLAGITSQQSDELFDTFCDVIIRIQQGAFPTALYRLQQKTPSGFVTQELLDTWILKIKGYM